MRVVSLVPSWTETLIECGVDVVGRSRFCIHPEQAHKIPAVGGTKDWNLEKIKALQPDLLVLDKEENPRFMAEEKGLSFWASHVESLLNLPVQMHELGEILNNQELLKLSERWGQVTRQEFNFQWSELPGVLHWLRPITGDVFKVYYVIWRDPWMHVSPNTFIGSMLKHLVPQGVLMGGAAKYPQVAPEELNDSKTLLLVSTEPFPFGKPDQQDRLLKEFSGPIALVDGEAFSWFGLRSLRFLENL